LRRGEKGGREGLGRIGLEKNSLIKENDQVDVWGTP